MLRHSLVGLLVLAGAQAAGAKSEPAGDALKRMVAGKTVRMDTPVGTIPVSYRANGTMTGRAKDMQLYLGNERDAGHWWVAANRICQKWDVWLSAKPYCFTVRLDGRLVHWRTDDGRSGTATIAHN